MEILGVFGFIFGLLAFVKIQKLERALKDKGVLGPDYKTD